MNGLDPRRVVGVQGPQTRPERSPFMRRRLCLLGASALTCVLALPVLAQDNTAPPHDADMPRDKQVDKAMAPDAKDICKTLSTATEAAIKKDGFDNLIKRFVDADRDRISKTKLTRADWDKLNAKIDIIQKDWKAKYNQDFNMDDPRMVYNEQFRIVQGVIGEPQPAGATMNGDKMDPGLPDLTPGAESDKIGGGDVNREKGRKVAKVTFPETHGMPALYIPMIREVPDMWKIDVPDQVDGQKLYDNLLNQLTMLEDHKDMWPTDVNDAYRAVSHHVLMAIMDQQKGPDMDKDHMMPGDKDNTTPGSGK